MELRHRMMGSFTRMMNRLVGWEGGGTHGVMSGYRDFSEGELLGCVLHDGEMSDTASRLVGNASSRHIGGFCMCERLFVSGLSIF